MTEINTLYRKEFVLKSDAKTQEAVLKEVGDYLFEKNVVTADFIPAIIEREREYPTGIDLTPIADDLPSIAVPHTDTEYCKTKMIVFVKLKESVLFYNMIKPKEPLTVRYLFLIINNEKKKQTNILSELMEFMTANDNMYQLGQLDSTEELYEFLKTTKGSGKND